MYAYFTLDPMNFDAVIYMWPSNFRVANRVEKVQIINITGA